MCIFNKNDQKIVKTPFGFMKKSQQSLEKVENRIRKYNKIMEKLEKSQQ